MIFFFLDKRLTSFYGMFELSGFNAPVSFAVTIITIILITNSFNLIDGIDGLAGTFSIVAFLFFGIWFFFADDLFDAVLCFALAGAILAFLLLNWEPSKVFMGETGSLFIGVMLSIFVIGFVNHNHGLPPDSEARFSSSVGTALCILIVPLTDTIRIIILRLYRGVSLFAADKRHIHHCMVRLGYSHRFTVCILCAAHITFICAAISLRRLGDWYVLAFAVVTATSLCLVLDTMIARHTQPKKPD